MFRIAKPESFVLVSPSKEAVCSPFSIASRYRLIRDGGQVGKQNAAECQALVQEPASAFYEDPVLVLDFQSLYPSIMIGYNYCYSTCLGRIDPFRGTFKMGWTAQDIPEGLIGQLRKHVTSMSMLLIIQVGP
jgi:DNA polymerase zeta